MDQLRYQAIVLHACDVLHVSPVSTEDGAKARESPGELAALLGELESTFNRWGEEAKQLGKFQNAALMESWLVECGVRFVQIYHCS